MASVSDTPSAAVPDALAVALVGAFGVWGGLAALAFKFGSPFVAKLIANSHAAADPTPEEWAKLDAEIDVPGEMLIPQRPTSAAKVP